MKLFTNETDINVWFKKAIENNAYVVEQPSTNPAFANKNIVYMKDLITDNMDA